MKTHYGGVVSYLILMLAHSAGGFAQKPAAIESKQCSVPAEGASTSGDAPIAIVGGRPIYKSDLTAQTNGQLLQLRQQQYNVEKQALEALIRQKVVEAEAKKQGLTVGQLYQKEVDSKVPEPTEAEARGYYLAVKNRTTLPFNDLKPQIMNFLKSDEIRQAQVKYADSLRAKADVSILLAPPTVEVSESDPARIEGNPNAPVTIVEFGDFQCPFCGRVEPTLMDLLRKYNGQVKLSFRDFPLSQIHPFAEGAAEAGRCAQAQGKFWPMHDAMYANQSKLDQADLIKTAASLGMNESAFATCLKSNAYQADIRRDVDAGQRAGVTGTPTFFINGRLLSGAVPEEQFEHIIGVELARLKRKNPSVGER